MATPPVSDPVDLEALLESKAKDIGAIGQAALRGEHAKVVDGVASLALGLAGHPGLGALVPFGRAVVARAFGESVDAMLRRELAQMQTEEERQAFIKELDSLIAASVGQAIVQMVRSQHHTKDEVLGALGGLRAEFESLRQDFAAALAALDPPESPAVQHIVERQVVEDGALGVRLRPETKNRLWLKFQQVRGVGSVGIEL